MEKIAVGIVGTGMCVPEKILTNAELAGILNVSEEWIETMSGIRQRHIAAPGQSASDLGLVAAQRALDRAGVAASELDLIIVATVTPDTQFPSTACLIGQRLGLVGTPAFDLTAVCSGFVYGVTVAEQFIRSGLYRTVLVAAVKWYRQ